MPTGDPSLPNYIEGPPAPGQRRATPFVFRCGRLVVLVVDARGDRDVFRKDHPILGAEQWGFIDTVFANLPEDVEALAVMTPTPIASMDPHGQTQNLLGDRTDDVVAFSKGRSQPKSSVEKGELPVTVANVHLSRLLGTQLNLGRYMLSKIDEARDQWSHKFARPEQADLLRKAGAARVANAIPGAARGLIFLSGDIHVGCIFDISCSKPEFEAASLTASGISANEDQAVIVGTFLDEAFSVAPGIRSTLREVTRGLQLRAGSGGADRHGSRDRPHAGARGQRGRGRAGPRRACSLARASKDLFTADATAPFQPLPVWAWGRPPAWTPASPADAGRCRAR